jgi:hypothetical protein
MAYSSIFRCLTDAAGSEQADLQPGLTFQAEPIIPAFSICDSLQAYGSILPQRIRSAPPARGRNFAKEILINRPHVSDIFFWPPQVVILSGVACERSEHATKSKNLSLSWT